MNNSNNKFVAFENLKRAFLSFAFAALAFAALFPFAGYVAGLYNLQPLLLQAPLFAGLFAMASVIGIGLDKFAKANRDFQEFRRSRQQLRQNLEINRFVKSVEGEFQALENAVKVAKDALEKVYELDFFVENPKFNLDSKDDNAKRAAKAEMLKQLYLGSSAENLLKIETALDNAKKAVRSVDALQNDLQKAKLAAFAPLNLQLKQENKGNNQGGNNNQNNNQGGGNNNQNQQNQQKQQAPNP